MIIFMVEAVPLICLSPVMVFSGFFWTQKKSWSCPYIHINLFKLKWNLKYHYWPRRLACAMRSLAIVITIVQSFFLFLVGVPDSTCGFVRLSVCACPHFSELGPYTVPRRLHGIVIFIRQNRCGGSFPQDIYRLSSLKSKYF